MCDRHGRPSRSPLRGARQRSPRRRRAATIAGRPTDAALRRLGDELAAEIVKPLPGENPEAGDGDCDLAAAHWRLIVADAVRRGRADTTVASIREHISERYWAASLPDEAIGRFLEDLDRRGVNLGR